MTFYYGTEGNDTISGTTGGDWFDGKGGNDTLLGNAGTDTIWGGTGDDEIRGGGENDLLSGQAGNDIVYGGYNNDTIFGDDGDDFLYGDNPTTGATGQDKLSGGAGNDILEGGPENDEYFFTFNHDGQDVIYDSQGSYDQLFVSGVSNLSGLEFKRGDYFGRDSNDLYVYTDEDAADGTMSEYITVDEFWSGSSAGTGRIEYLYVGGTQYWFNDVVWGL